MNGLCATNSCPASRPLSFPLWWRKLPSCRGQSIKELRVTSNWTSAAPIKSAVILYHPTKSNKSKSIYIHIGSPSKKLLIHLQVLSSHDPAPSMQRIGATRRQQALVELLARVHTQWVSPWKVGSVQEGRATGWFSSLSIRLSLASCFSMSSYGVQDRSCWSL